MWTITKSLLSDGVLCRISVNKFDRMKDLTDEFQIILILEYI